MTRPPESAVAGALAVVAEMREIAVPAIIPDSSVCDAINYWADRLAATLTAPSEAVATVCLSGERYAHGYFQSIEVQLAVESQPIPQGAKLYLAPVATPPASQDALVRELVEAASRMMDFADHEYVPNVTFARLKQALAALERKP